MRLNWLPATVGMLTLAACNANFTVQVPKTTPLSKASVTKAAPTQAPESPSPEPSTEASVAPSLAPASLAPASIAPSLAPASIAPVLNPFGVPTTVRLPMPASVISVGGGNLIGQAGGNIISTGGGNYRLAQAGAQPPKPLLSAAIKENMFMYLSTTDMADMLLMAAGSGKLKPGVPLTLSMPGMPTAYTYLLEIKDDHAVFSIGKGNEARGPGQMIGISYTSPKKGRMVLWSHDPALGIETYIASDFDLEKGVATADGYGITQGVHTQCHWEFATPEDASGKSFVIRSNSAESGGDAVNAFAAHFMKDGSAVGATALADAASGGKLVMMPNDGIWSSHDQQKPYDLYLSADGKDMETAAAGDALKAMVPTLADFIDPVPPIPTVDHNPKTDARFKFPD